MDWVDSIKEIRERIKYNQLVIFVGAGVSFNSLIPKWSDLVKQIDLEINYSKNNICPKCKKKTNCSIKPCDEIKYTNEEMLRIPEYFYQHDKTPKHVNYYKLIKETLKCDSAISNGLDNLILDLLPHYIITTNYDELLEKSDSTNTRLYTVIREDKNMLSLSKERKIIKMHGDINKNKSIVLKESDYINYEQKHPLITTFIKSLLLDHTFLFVGYSLNDNNLNLIIGWINYFQKLSNVKKTPKNFLLTPGDDNTFERKRLEDKNIFVIDTKAIPDNISSFNNIPADISGNKIATNLYLYLECIRNDVLFDSCIPLSQQIIDSYKILKSYKYISHEDLIAVKSLGEVDFINSHLIIAGNYYKAINELIKNENKTVIQTLKKANITKVKLRNSDEFSSISTLEGMIKKDKLLALYLNNDYKNLLDTLQKNSNAAQKIYYYCLLKQDDFELAKLDKENAIEVKNKDFIAILLYQMRSYLISIKEKQYIHKVKKRELNQIIKTLPEYDKKSAKYLTEFFTGKYENILSMDKLLNTQKNNYSCHIYRQNKHKEFSKIQDYAYDYYFYIKLNYLPIDLYSDAKSYLSFYLQAILCSYSPAPPNSNQPNIFHTTIYKPEHFPLNEIDLDMLIKYANKDSLLSWLQKYSVRNLVIDEHVNFVKKYENLCNSFILLRNRDFITQIYNFIILSCLIQFDNKSKERIFIATISLLENTLPNNILYKDFLEINYYLLIHFDKDISDNKKLKLLKILLSASDKEAIYANNYMELICRLAPFSKKETKQLIESKIPLIIPDKCHYIFTFRKLLSMDTYKDFLMNNLKHIDTDDLFYFVSEQTIPYTQAVTDIFLDKLKSLENLTTNHIMNNEFENVLDSCLIFGIADDLDINDLKAFVKRSEHLEFMLNPETFDYKKVDMRNYMWKNLIYSKKYGHYFKDHKTNIVDTVKEDFLNKVETREQQKIVYHYLLDDDEIYEFPLPKN